jgi:hypothetical protein
VVERNSMVPAAEPRPAHPKTLTRGPSRSVRSREASLGSSSLDMRTIFGVNIHTYGIRVAADSPT